MKAIDRWLEENFDRESKSMPGSSVSVTYVSKPLPTEFEIDDSALRGHANNAGWARMPISIVLVLGSTLASMTWLMA